MSVLEDLVRLNEVSLIVPSVVMNEFVRNKARVVDECRRGLSTVFKRVKDAVDRFGDPITRASVLQQLNEVDHQIPLLGEAAARSVARIEDLLSRAIQIPDTDAIKVRAAERRLKSVAPFHRQRNGIGDQSSSRHMLSAL